MPVAVDEGTVMSNFRDTLLKCTYWWHEDDQYSSARWFQRSSLWNLRWRLSKYMWFNV